MNHEFYLYLLLVMLCTATVALFAVVSRVDYWRHGAFLGFVVGLLLVGWMKSREVRRMGASA